MTNITAFTDIELQQALREYSLAPLESFTLAKDGIENSNYLIRTEDERRFVFTVLEQPSFSPHTDYVALLDSCAVAGLPVPSIIRTSSNQTSIVVDGKPALLSRYLTGAHVSNPTRCQLAAVGRFLGRLHRIDYKPSNGITLYPRNAEWLRDSLTKLSPLLSFKQSALLAQAITACEQLFTREDIRSLPWGTIHGDLFRDNVLFTEQGLSGVLDFHHAASGYFLFDLAVAANDWCAEANGLMNMDRTLALLRGYHQQKPLTETEVWWFSVFGLYAATVFFTSRLRTQKLDQTARCKDPQEMEQLLTGYLSHPVQLHWSLLG
jgi:homoserine kinase type II